ncbi:hypothetical protein F5Y01DRAFT_308755 [Xylaria sp. FL0043]|nr:hypothetical protein F5Y01DRAFT_308755 [Xylaria sp. FL0043]
MAVPSHRMSFASFEDDDPFFSAYSSHPTSRVMSMSGITPQRWGQEEEQLPGDVNSVALHSEPLASVCQPRVGVDISDKGAFTANSNVNKPLSSPAPVTATRRSSSASAREECLDAQGCVPPVPSTQFHGHVDKQGIDGISCNVRAFLATRRKRAGLGKPVANENETPLSSILATPYKPHLQLPTEPDEQYLITTDDITGIIDIVIAGVRSIQDDAIQLDCRSRLLPSSTHTRPTLCAQNIIPGVSAVADPATTFCSPQPCFSLANDSEKFRRLLSTPKTTYTELFSHSFLRNDSYHEATRADKSGVETPEPPNYLPLHNRGNRYLSWPQSRRIVRRASCGNSTPYKIPSPFGRRYRRRPGERSTSEPISQRTLSDELSYVVPITPITSFPRLISRSCTNDWLTPLGLLDETDNYESVERRDMIADLYHDSVDAHTCSYDPLPILEEDPQSIPIPPPPPQVPFEDYQSHNHELGRSIDASCHKRIRARNSLTQHQDINDNYSDCLRRHSFVPLLEHTPEYIQRLQEGDRGQKRSSRELLQQILDRSNSPSINAAGSYSGSRTPNMAGSQDSKLQSELEGSSCSEDGEPHICIDEQETGGSSLQN